MALRQILSQHKIKEASTLNINLIIQCELEKKYGLSYFDSLIAASALALDKQIISDDQAFDRIPYLKRISLSHSPNKPTKQAQKSTHKALEVTKNTEHSSRTRR